MTRSHYLNHLLAILCYDSLVNTLSIADRYWCHREIIANNTSIMQEAIVTEASGKIMQISNHIRNIQWYKPELRYNSDRTLEVYDSVIGSWKIFKPSNYV